MRLATPGNLSQALRVLCWHLPIILDPIGSTIPLVFIGQQNLAWSWLTVPLPDHLVQSPPLNQSPLRRRLACWYPCCRYTIGFTNENDICRKNGEIPPLYIWGGTIQNICSGVIKMVLDVRGASLDADKWHHLKYDNIRWHHLILEDVRWNCFK